MTKRFKSIVYSLWSIVFIFTFLSIFLPELSYSANSVNVRVRVKDNVDKVLLSIKGRYKIEAIHSDLLLDEGRNLKDEYVIPAGSGVKLGDKEFKIYGIRVIPRSDAAIYIDEKPLRGVVDIVRTENLKLMVVNHLDIEKYLYGVLYHEMPHYWPMEALKAQAITARTFAFYRGKNSRDKDYDVTSDIYSQVYGGRESERWRTKQAVDSTRGKILSYDGRILPTYYHAICAGHTESAKVVFDIDLPPLEGRSCHYCKGARGFYWKAMFSYKQIEERLNEYGIKASGINFIEEGKRDASGRLLAVKIKDKSGTKEIQGFKFRLALDPNVIRSTDFKIKITPKGVIFRGQGWGHGVGMCQWGAFGMARVWKSHKDILAFYYPGSRIVSMKELEKP